MQHAAKFGGEKLPLKIVVWKSFLPTAAFFQQNFFIVLKLCHTQQGYYVDAKATNLG